LVESLHRGHLVAARPDSGVVACLGDPDFPTYLRSAAKPLQAVAVVEDGAADRYGFSPPELAVMCGSVSGQDFHVAAVRSILAKMGWDESLLACGVHRPSHRGTAKRLLEAGAAYLPVHNNCAGKHAAMLALCAHHGWDPKGYVRGDHPVQEHVHRIVAELCGLPGDRVETGVDGCGVPVFRLPLRNLAAAYGRLAAPDEDGSLGRERCEAIRRLTGACLAHPEMVAGDERLCTDVMRAAGGRVFAKTGAEGSYGIALPELRLGIAFKVEDGAMRALGPAAVAILQQLGALPAAAVNGLARHSRQVLKNHRGEEVGELVSVLRLPPMETG
jgi:L-asparaginase II